MRRRPLCLAQLCLCGDALRLDLGDPLGDQHRVGTCFERRSVLSKLAVTFGDLHSSRFAHAVGGVLAVVGECLNRLLTPLGCERQSQPGIEVIEHVGLA
ncbi:hypothetical protein [Microbispora sp. NPDC046933]|uniref:hypothetical protein n=1 Tax=Microbispora sp. NPDC046933 TaxID=3155618 RepID=UPI003401CD93